MNMTMTPELDDEGIDDESISDFESETVDTPAETERAPQGNSDKPATADESNYDISKIPKELRPQFEEALKNKDLEWKRTFTRKTQESSARQKALEAEAASAKAQLAQYQRIGSELMADPSKIDAYRKLYAPQTVANEPPPKFESVEDILDYVDKKYTNNLSVMKQSLLNETTQTLQAKQSEIRWEGALQGLRADPRFKKYEAVVAQMTMRDQKYKQYYTGDNEQEVLKMAYDDFVGMIDEDVNTGKQELLTSLKAKKSASTQSPRRTVATDAARPATSKDDIIARVNQRLGD